MFIMYGTTKLKGPLLRSKLWRSVNLLLTGDWNGLEVCMNSQSTTCCLQEKNHWEPQVNLKKHCYTKT